MKQELMLEIERKKINNVDKDIVKLLNRRFSIVKNISNIKKQFNLPILNKGREKIVFEKVSKNSTNPELSLKIFKEIVTQSKRLQEELK